MKSVVSLLIQLLIGLGLSQSALAAYNLEVPVDPWEEYRLQFKTYSQLLLKSYDRAFINDYDGALREVNKAIELLPDEGLGYSERAYYYQMMNRTAAAEGDLLRALALFGQTLERYRPAKGTKKKIVLKKPDPVSAARLVATTHYQRGEAYFRFEDYKAAADDFALACQGGETVACSKMWETKMIQKRGTNWVPVTSRQFFDKNRVENISPGMVRVWIRREDAPVMQTEAALQGALQQHLELRCGSGDYRILEGFSAMQRDDDVDLAVVERYQKPVAGSAVSKLLYRYCDASKRK